MLKHILIKNTRTLKILGATEETTAGVTTGLKR